MTESLLKLITICGKNNIDYDYTIKNGKGNFIHYEKEKKLLVINISNPDDKQIMKEIEREYNLLKELFE